MNAFVMTIDYLKIKDLLDEVSRDGLSASLVKVTVDEIHHLTRTLFEFLSEFTLDMDVYTSVNYMNIGMLISRVVEILTDRAVENIRDIAGDDEDVDDVVGVLKIHIDKNLVAIDIPKRLAYEDVDTIANPDYYRNQDIISHVLKSYNIGKVSVDSNKSEKETMTSRYIIERLLKSLESYVLYTDEEVKTLRIKTDRVEKARKIVYDNIELVGNFQPFMDLVDGFEEDVNGISVNHPPHLPTLKSTIERLNVRSLESVSRVRTILSETFVRSTLTSRVMNHTLYELRSLMMIPTYEESLRSLFVSEDADCPMTRLRSDVKSLLDDVRNLEY